MFCLYLQSFASEMNSLVALHELYKYINKYYDQVTCVRTHIYTCTCTHANRNPASLTPLLPLGHTLLQIIMSLDEDSSGQKMQLAYRLQQVAALVENKVTDL